MKTYLKPQIDTLTVFSSEQLANGGLGTWIEDTAGLDSTENITTYQMGS